MAHLTPLVLAMLVMRITRGKGRLESSHSPKLRPVSSGVIGMVGWLGLVDMFGWWLVG